MISEKDKTKKWRHKRRKEQKEIRKRITKLKLKKNWKNVEGTDDRNNVNI